MRSLAQANKEIYGDVKKAFLHPLFEGDFVYNNHTVAAVIVAAGSSTRMKSDKMLLPLLGMSVIARTVNVFSKCGFFDEIILLGS